MIEYAILKKRRGRDLEDDLNLAAKKGWVLKCSFGNKALILARLMKNPRRV